MLIIIFVIIGISILIVGHEAGHFLVAKFFGMKVDEFGFGFPPRIGAKKIGETEYSFNWLPFGGFVRIAGEMDEGTEYETVHMTGPDEARMFYARPAWTRALVIFAGVAVNFLIGWLLISSALMAGIPKSLVVSGVEDGSPAATAGFKTGDVLQDYKDASAFITFVNAHRGQDTVISVERDGATIAVHAMPRVEVPTGEGALGVYVSEGGEPPEGILTALGDGFTRSLEIAWLTLAAFYDLLRNLLLHGALIEGVVGPVGIVRVAEGAGVLGFVYLINLIGLISLNLSIVNLLPFPALDGGRLVLIAIEKIKGSPVSRRVERTINVVGLAVLILLMIFITVRDAQSLF